MTRKVIHIAVNGVTGRMGYRQHLVRSLLSIREQGGVRLEDGTTIFPEPILVGRNEERLRAIAERHGLERWTTSLDEVLGDPEVDVYFDTQVTSARETALLQAIEAGKHVYTEKPLAGTLEGALRLARAAKAAGITNGVVHDKLFLPGVLKLQRLLHEGFFGRVLSVRLEFGYWVFEGDEIPSQRPSWNYRAEEGGGIVLDMFPHWQYLLTDLFGPISALYARNTTHIPRRWDEAGQPYKPTADDAAYAVLEFASGAFASVNSSWAVQIDCSRKGRRIRRSKLSLISDYRPCLPCQQLSIRKQTNFLQDALVWPVYRQAHAATPDHSRKRATWNRFAVSSVFLPPSPRAPRRAEVIPRRLADRRAPS